ncbi:MULTISPECIES: STAS domain-containing protein [Streptomyces]|uniref:Anti-sigma factor antagonist n=1 Tax=Streptomyces edwardsiae TaxID=3075527 RepID=A0ABU2PQU0_9ACTN|nr:STAS domain-containing protein [Streptomyces sp. DSM 41636]MDT0394527.1 STAS domain-containing protein [Streptomyces sp. DSM 41636]
MNPLSITTQDATTGPVLEIFGDLDYTTVGELRERLTALTLRPGQRLVLDLAGMTFCDSSGITALIAARNQTHAAHADIALAAVPAHTLRVLRMVGLDQIFVVHPDSDAATRP